MGDDGKVEYLQLIQEPISRMSTSSAIFKGFSATIVAGVAALTYSGLNTWIMILSFLPILSFAALDVYYLQLEKKYRLLYNQVASGAHKVDFSMNLTKDKKEIKKEKLRIWDCIMSPSILIFYPLMIAVLIVVILMKTTGGV